MDGWIISRSSSSSNMTFCQSYRIEYIARELKANLTSFGIGGLTVNNETNGDPTYAGAGRAMLV